MIISASSSAHAEPYKILTFGDSLTAGYGLEDHANYPRQLEEMLIEQGHDIKVINAGVSGETTAGGLNRLDWTLKHTPDLILLSLGANDGLRFLPPEKAEENLSKMIQKIQAQNIDLVLIGMRAPRNHGADYIKRYDSIYPRLSEKYNIALYPFHLEGVFGNPHLNLADGLHPNSEGHKIVAKNLVPFVTPFLKDAVK